MYGDVFVLVLRVCAYTYTWLSRLQFLNIPNMGYSWFRADIGNRVMLGAAESSRAEPCRVKPCRADFLEVVPPVPGILDPDLDLNLILLLPNS